MQEMEEYLASARTELVERLVALGVGALGTRIPAKAVEACVIAR